MDGENSKSPQWRALVVDDDEITRHLMQRLLQVWGIPEVILCGCAEEGLRVLRTAPEAIDVLFLDMNLPEMNALDFVRQFDAQTFNGQLILLSAEDEQSLINAENEIARRGIKVLGHLQKPISRNRINDLLTRL